MKVKATILRTEMYNETVDVDVPEGVSPQEHIDRILSTDGWDALVDSEGEYYECFSECTAIEGHELLKTFTIAVCEDTKEGTHHVASYNAPNIETAKEYAIAETAADWGRDDDDIEGLMVLWVAEGDVTLLEYNDV